MNRIDAIYTRQSALRPDSISVESQAELCAREVVGSDYKIYTDKGYSGKNTDRPAVQQLIKDISTGRIKRVIVYRLDRISRSVLDFANLIEVFQKYNVDFVSTMEKFDTGTPIGKAMLMIVMIFAQLERETIQQRVIDAYQSRSKRGFYMGGRVPFGFELTETTIDGVRTKMYKSLEHEAEIVRLIFSMYSQPQTSLGDVARHLNGRNITKRDGKPFTPSRIRDIIINPAYVRADYMLYDFFQKQGTNIINPPEDFIGSNGAYFYSGEAAGRKTISLEGQILVLAPHEGLVDSRTWIKSRRKCLANSQTAKPIKARGTWLAGKIKCAHCGYALNLKVYHCKTKADNRYYLCGSKYHAGSCGFGSLNADAVDALVLEEMKRKLMAFPSLKCHRNNQNDAHIAAIKARIGGIDQEISALTDKIGSASPTVMEYINERITQLDSRKKVLYDEIIRQQKSEAACEREITGYMDVWEELSVSDKMTVVDCLIECIRASEEKIGITWKI